MRDPSSSRILDFAFSATSWMTSSGIGICSFSTFFLRIAIRVSSVGGLDVRDQPPLEARREPLLERGDLLRRPVARDDDLLVRVVQRVERVEELLLRALLAGEKMDVVDEENVHAAVACP